MHATVCHTIEYPKALCSIYTRWIHINKLLGIYSGPSITKTRSSIEDTNVNYVIQGVFPYIKGWIVDYKEIQRVLGQFLVIIQYR